MKRDEANSFLSLKSAAGHSERRTHTRLQERPTTRGALETKEGFRVHTRRREDGARAVHRGHAHPPQGRGPPAKVQIPSRPGQDPARALHRRRVREGDLRLPQEPVRGRPRGAGQLRRGLRRGMARRQDGEDRRLQVRGHARPPGGAPRGRERARGGAARDERGRAGLRHVQTVGRAQGGGQAHRQPRQRDGSVRVRGSGCKSVVRAHRRGRIEGDVLRVRAVRGGGQGGEGGVLEGVSGVVFVAVRGEDGARRGFGSTQARCNQGNTCSTPDPHLAEPIHS